MSAYWQPFDQMVQFLYRPIHEAILVICSAGSTMTMATLCGYIIAACLCIVTPPGILQVQCIPEGLAGAFANDSSE